jgi:hypothetical protein
VEDAIGGSQHEGVIIALFQSSKAAGQRRMPARDLPEDSFGRTPRGSEHGFIARVAQSCFTVIDAIRFASPFAVDPIALEVIATRLEGCETFATQFKGCRFVLEQPVVQVVIISDALFLDEVVIQDAVWMGLFILVRSWRFAQECLHSDVAG